MLSFVFIGSFTTQVWQSNCYLLAAENSNKALVIDPGIGATPIVERALADNNFVLDAVVCTHGHVDHIASAAQLANAAQVPVFLNQADKYMLTDPAAGLGEDSKTILTQLDLLKLPKPDDLRDLPESQLKISSIEFDIFHLPGHSPGCVNLRTHSEAGILIFTGDVLFKQSVGRTDLPGGNPKIMKASLDRLKTEFELESIILPGHGQTSTMEYEIANNPYLATPSLL